MRVAPPPCACRGADAGAHLDSPIPTHRPAPAPRHARKEATEQHDHARLERTSYFFRFLFYSRVAACRCVVDAPEHPPDFWRLRLRGARLPRPPAHCPAARASGLLCLQGAVLAGGQAPRSGRPRRGAPSTSGSTYTWRASGAAPAAPRRFFWLLLFFFLCGVARSAHEALRQGVAFTSSIREIVSSLIFIGIVSSLPAPIRPLITRSPSMFCVMRL